MPAASGCQQFKWHEGVTVSVEMFQNGEVPRDLVYSSFSLSNTCIPGRCNEYLKMQQDFPGSDWEPECPLQGEEVPALVRELRFPHATRCGRKKKINTWCWSVKQVKTQGSGTSWWSRVQWLRLCAPSAGGLGSLPCGGTRSHLLQLRVHIPQLKIPRASTKVWQPNKQVNKENLKVQIITSRSFTCVRDIRKSWRKKNNSSPVRLPCTW